MKKHLHFTYVWLFVLILFTLAMNSCGDPLTSGMDPLLDEVDNRKPVQPLMQSRLEVFYSSRTFEVGDLVEIVISAELDELPVSGVNLFITHVGLTEVIISNGGLTDHSGLVRVRGTIADDRRFIQADWEDKGLSVRSDLSQSLMQPHLGVSHSSRTFEVGDLVEIVISAELDELPASGVNLFITHVGLTEVTISNGGLTDFSGLVRVRGRIADGTYGFIQANWPDKGLSVTSAWPLGE